MPSCTGRSVAFVLDREPGIDLLIADSRTLATRRKVRLGIDVQPSWAPEDSLIALSKGYGYGVGYLSILDPRTGHARRVSNAGDFIWWSAPRHGVVIGSLSDPDNPIVDPRLKGPTPYGVPGNLSEASRGKVVTLEGVLYSNQGRYGAFVSASELSHIPGFESPQDMVWTKSQGVRTVGRAFPIETDRVIAVWTSPSRLLMAGADSAGPLLAVQGLESGTANYRLKGLRGNESIVGFVHP